MDYFKDFFDLFGIGLKYVLNVFALLAIYDGMRRIFMKKISKSVFAFLAIGLAYCLGSSGNSYFMANALESLKTPNEELRKLGKLPVDWGADLLPEVRAERTNNIAQVYFKEFGKYNRVTDLNGKWRSFSPTEKDIKSRDKVIAQRIETKIIIERLKDISIYWVISMFVAILLGRISAHPKLGKEFGFDS